MPTPTEIIETIDLQLDTDQVDISFNQASFLPNIVSDVVMNTDIDPNGEVSIESLAAYLEDDVNASYTNELYNFSTNLAKGLADNLSIISSLTSLAETTTNGINERYNSILTAEKADVLLHDFVLDTEKFVFVKPDYTSNHTDIINTTCEYANIQPALGVAQLNVILGRTNMMVKTIKDLKFKDTSKTIQFISDTYKKYNIDTKIEPGSLTSMMGFAFSSQGHFNNLVNYLKNMMTLSQNKGDTICKIDEFANQTTVILNNYQSYINDLRDNNLITITDAEDMRHNADVMTQLVYIMEYYILCQMTNVFDTSLIISGSLEDDNKLFINQATFEDFERKGLGVEDLYQYMKIRPSNVVPSRGIKTEEITSSGYKDKFHAFDQKIRNQKESLRKRYMTAAILKFDYRNCFNTIRTRFRNFSEKQFMNELERNCMRMSNDNNRIEDIVTMTIINSVYMNTPIQHLYNSIVSEMTTLLNTQVEITETDINQAKMNACVSTLFDHLKEKQLFN